jgi:hypothetical protein
MRTDRRKITQLRDIFILQLLIANVTKRDKYKHRIPV